MARKRKPVFGRKRTVFDTSVFIHYWRTRVRPGLVRMDSSENATVAAHAFELSRLTGVDATVTPVVLEFLCGFTSREEMELAKVFLLQFRVIDGGYLLKEDWTEARRIAERVPRSGKPRQLGDCLVRAVANRYNYSVETYDAEFPR
jgi:predicted nucleic acid-binding protein